MTKREIRYHRRKRFKFSFNSFKFKSFPEYNPTKEPLEYWGLMIPAGVLKDSKGNEVKIASYEEVLPFMGKIPTMPRVMSKEEWENPFTGNMPMYASTRRIINDVKNSTNVRTWYWAEYDNEKMNVISDNTICQSVNVTIKKENYNNAGSNPNR